MSLSNDTMRICKDCKRELPATSKHFISKKSSINGKFYFMGCCRDCWNVRRRAHHLENPAIKQGQRQRYLKRHPELIKEQKRQSHIRCRVRNNERSKHWHYANKDHVRELHAQQYQENRETVLQRALDYQASHPEYVKAREARRRARITKNGGNCTTTELTDLYTQQEGRCGFCGIPVFYAIKGDVHLEHMTPLSRGGTNDITNLVFSCSNCNLSKHDKTVDEWRAARGW